MIKETSAVSFDNIEEAMKKVVSAKHAELLSVNLNAVFAGYNYN